MPAGNGNAVLGCSLLAHQMGLPVLRPNAGEGRDDHDAAKALNSSLLDKLADVLYTRAPKSHYALYKEGLLAERMVPVGNLTADVVAELAPASREALDQYLSNNAPLSWQRRAGKGYAVVTAQLSDGDLGPGRAAQLFAALQGAGRESAVLWPADESTARVLAETGSQAELALDGVCIVPAVDYVQFLQLLRGAQLLIAGPRRVGVEEAIALSAPVVVLHPGGVAPARSEQDGVVRVGLGSPQCAKTVRDARRAHVAESDARASHASEAIATHIARWNDRRHQAGASTDDVSGQHHGASPAAAAADNSPRASARAKESKPKPVAPVR
jgi:UDP-N-acetylglucosamine 2-epimerase